MDGIKIIPYPVRPEKNSDDNWWGSRDIWARNLREYGKLLISYAREPGARPTQKDKDTP